MKSLSQIITPALLAAIALLLALIYRRLPATAGEYRAAGMAERARMESQMPLVQIHGDVGVSGRVDVRDMPAVRIDR